MQKNERFITYFFHFSCWIYGSGLKLPHIMGMMMLDSTTHLLGCGETSMCAGANLSSREANAWRLT